MLPTRSREFFERGRGGQIEKLFRMQSEYMAVVEDVIAPMRRQGLMDAAYDKVLLRLGGFPMPLRLLSPYDSFPEEVFEECRHILQDRYADWMG